MSVIYLLRHGETEWNVERRRQGRLNSPLTALGRQQAESVGARLAAELARIEAPRPSMTSSPLGRARETALAVAAHLGVEERAVRSDPLLAEHHLGEWQGLVDSEIDCGYPGARAERTANRWTFVVPGGESYERLAVRGAEWLASVASEPLLVAVAHEMINRVLIGNYCGLTPDETLALWHPHGCIYRLADGRCEEVAPLD